LPHARLVEREANVSSAPKEFLRGWTCLPTRCYSFKTFQAEFHRLCSGLNLDRGKRSWYEQRIFGEEDVMFSLLWELLIGLVVGAVAKLLMPGKEGGGIWITMALGIAGSLLATYLGRFLGWYQDGQAAGFIMSVLGAIVLLFIYKLIRKKAA
jgi:uncharacterized membrane protein YeaQ/YmgE (transglycosylase-associated protein family)